MESKFDPKSKLRDLGWRTEFLFKFNRTWRQTVKNLIPIVPEKLFCVIRLSCIEVRAVYCSSQIHFHFNSKRGGANYVNESYLTWPRLCWQSVPGWSRLVSDLPREALGPPCGPPLSWRAAEHGSMKGCDWLIPHISHVGEIYTCAQTLD
jgi:hypothetical protein